MKAAVYEKFGGPEVVEICEVAKPLPEDNEVLVKIYAATVSAADHRARAKDLPPGLAFFGPLVFGWSRPKMPILGMDLSGVIEAVGRDVSKFKVGDEIFALSGHSMGCHAEYICLVEDSTIALKPSSISFEQATSLIFGGHPGLDFLERAEIKPGQTYLVNGASGCVGTALVQLAKHYGAEVTAVCSGRNSDLVKSIGANHVVDYTVEDFTKNGRTYDAIADCVGNAPFSRVKNSLTKNGKHLPIIAGGWAMLVAPIQTMLSSKKVLGSTIKEKQEYLQTLADLATSGAFIPVIDRTYPFAEIIEAHRHVDTGHKRGNVVLTMVSQD